MPAMSRALARNATASIKHRMLVPVLSMAVCLLHVKELYGANLGVSLAYIGAFGLFYVVWIWCAYSAAFLVSAARQRKRGSAPELGFGAHAALATVASISGLYLAQTLSQLIFHAFIGQGALRGIGPVPFFATNAALFLLVTAFRSFRERLEALKRATIEAQYTTLKNQLRPHVLFNSLNSLRLALGRGLR